MYSYNTRIHNYFFFRFVPRPPAIDAPRALLLPLPLRPALVVFLASLVARGMPIRQVRQIQALGSIADVPGDCSRPSPSSSSAYSVPPSVPVAMLSRGVGDTLSSPLSCVSALLSLSPLTRPAMFLSLLFPFLPPARRPIGEGEVEGEEDGRDAVVCIRRTDTMGS